MNITGSFPVNHLVTRGRLQLPSFLRPWLLRNSLPCVGLIAFAGCFTFLIVPEDNFAPVPRPPGAQQLHLQPVAGPPTVVLDPGHGGIDDGTKYFGLAEKTMTLDVALRLQKLLTSNHVNTILTRTEDVYVSLPARAEIANKVWESNSNVIFVSIHFNQSAVESVDGIETYYADQKIPPPNDWSWIGFFNHPDVGQLDLGQTLAADIQGTLAARMGLTNRGIKSRSLYVTRHTRMPAVLVEGGFLSNKVENEMLHVDGYRDRLVQGLAAGILTYTSTMHPGTSPTLVTDLIRQMNNDPPLPVIPPALPIPRHPYKNS